jgi:hypothetical protein
MIIFLMPLTKASGLPLLFKGGGFQKDRYPNGTGIDGACERITEGKARRLTYVRRQAVPACSWDSFLKWQPDLPGVMATERMRQRPSTKAAAIRTAEGVRAARRLLSNTMVCPTGALLPAWPRCWNGGHKTGRSIGQPMASISIT